MMANPITAVTMPKWGIEMTEGTITSWRVRVGERIERGAEILDVETEKIVNAVESPGSGVLRRIIADEGETRAVGALIGVIADEQVGDADVARFVDAFVGAIVSFDPDASDSPAAGVAPAPATAAVGDAAGGEETRVSPIARRIAERLGVDLSQVTGTGRNGRISKEDVEAYAARTSGAAAATATTAASGAGETAGAVPQDAARVASSGDAPATRRVPMNARRLTIARRLTESKQSIPHYRLDIDVDFGPLLAARRARAAGGAERVTVNDLLLRAVALALVEHPMVNAQFDGEAILQFVNADVAIAVAADAGLVTPIVRHANLKSVAEIARESRDLIERAGRGTLKREEITGGSFTVSNLGMFGVSRFDAIINAPQVAILAVGAATPRAIVRDGAVVATQVATLTLSADHRVVDGAVGAAFLASLRDLLSDPRKLG
jgi:pyruvate dehydrogenase E2 component (dihydrolipoamide acetyltransferase)